MFSFVLEAREDSPALESELPVQTGESSDQQKDPEPKDWVQCESSEQ